MNWKLVWREHSFTEDDLTGADLFAAQVVTADGWRSCDPTAGPVHAANLCAILIARSTQRTLEDVISEMGAAPAVEVAGLIQSATSAQASASIGNPSEGLAAT